MAVVKQLATSQRGNVSYYKDTTRPVLMGDDVAESGSVLDSSVVKTALSLGFAYHGYKRTGSVGWALAYVLLGRIAPVITGGVVLAQGVGQKKGT